jgi:hypothetical protein
MSESPREATLEAFADDSSATLAEGETEAEADTEIFTTGNGTYGTPRDWIRAFHDAIGGKFGLDPTSGAEPIPIADTRFTKADDGLSQSWLGYDSIYLNPPFDKFEEFYRLLIDTLQADDGPRFAVSVATTNISTNWFHKFVVPHAVAIAMPDSRVEYHGAGSNNKCPTIFCLFGNPPEELLEVFANRGALFSPVEVEAAHEQQRLDELLSDGGAMAAIPATGPTLGQGTAGFDAQGHSLEFIDPNDRLDLVFETDSLSAIAEKIPEHVSVRVLPDGKSIDPETGDITIDCIGKSADGTDVCLTLHNSPNRVTNLTVEVALGLHGWIQAIPKSIEIK